jgi:hypothetical protein
MQEEVGARAEAFFYAWLNARRPLPNCPALSAHDPALDRPALSVHVEVGPRCWRSSTRSRFFPSLPSGGLSDALGFDFALVDKRTGLKTMLEVTGTAAPTARSFYLSANELRVARLQGDSYAIAVVSDVMGEPRLEHVFLNPMRSAGGADDGSARTAVRVGRLLLTPSAYRATIGGEGTSDKTAQRRGGGAAR